MGSLTEADGKSKTTDKETFMSDNLRAPALLLARVLLAIIFVVSGYGKIMGYAGTMAYMTSHSLPAAQILLPLTILVELGGGLLLILGLFTRQVALLIFLFLIPVTLVFHTSGEKMDQLMLMKNLSTMGGMLALAVAGAGAWSLDVRRRGGA